MPEVTGFDIALELRKSPVIRPVLLVAVTCYSDPFASEMTAKVGFDCCLRKPIELQKLLGLLHVAYRLDEVYHDGESDGRPNYKAK